MTAINTLDDAVMLVQCEHEASRMCRQLDEFLVTEASLEENLLGVETAAHAGEALHGVLCLLQLIALQGITQYMSSWTTGSQKVPCRYNRHALVVTLHVNVVIGHLDIY